MKQRNKIILIIVAILLLVAGGIWYGKHQLWKAQPADAIPIAQKEKTPLDLRPAAIAKLQGLVKSGSDSLYKLRIDSLFTEVSSGTIVLKGVGIYPDSSELGRLHTARLLPDDVFEIELSTLRISGIGLGDIVHHRDMHIRAISATGPHIKVHHKLQPYNAAKREAAKHESLFSKLKGQIDRIAIDSISVGSHMVIDFNGGVQNTFKEVSMLLSNILVDSSAERDNSRFLFAKAMSLKAGSINIPVGNGQYDLSIGDIAIAGEKREVHMRQFALHPRGGKEVFARQQKTQKSVYTVDAPLVVLRKANWWAAIHGESIIAEEMEGMDVRMNAYLDRHMPPSPLKRDNFPQQLLAGLSSAVSIKRAVIKNATLEFEEFNNRSNNVSKMTYGKLFMTVEGITNVPEEVAKNPVARVHASAQFLNQTPLEADFRMELPRNRKGAFTADVKIGALGHDAVNPFSEDMGLIRFTSGQMQSGSGHIEGNNDHLTGKVSVRYTNLHLEPLKTKEDEEGRLKGKHVAKRLANVLFVKDNNPSRNELREPEFSLDRTKESNFFSFVWSGLKLGLLKTIGVPPALGMKKK